MIVIQQQDNRVSVAVYGEFTLADFREFEEAVNHKVSFAGPVDLLMDLREMADFTVDVAWEDIAFARAHPNDFKRIAVVTQSQWVAWSAWLSQIFVSAETGLFDDVPEAAAWLDAEEDEAAFSTLVSCEALAAHLDASDWRIVDCRHRLSDTLYGERAYAEGRLPGAVFMRLDRDLSGPMTGKNGRHPLPDPEILAVRLAAAGVSERTQVVVYDDDSGMSAARLWWMLRWLGHDRVAVLDGGIGAWIGEGRPLTVEPPVLRAAKFEARPRDWVVTAQQVRDELDKLETNESCLIDARAPDRFRGENEGMDPVGGHIPGARNRFFRDNLDASGKFLPAAELRRQFLDVLAGADPGRAVMYCGSGVTACHNLLALELAGLPGARLYAGSWSEWCADPGRPVAR
jgi:thiosulfate/3-mercaptopyruvate sulfurtransferase